MANLEEYETVRNWMSRLAPSTQRVQLAFFRNFYAWYRERGGELAELTPDQLIEYQRAAGNGAQFKVLDMAQRYITQSPGTFNTKNSRMNNIRSFFVHNRAELPKDKSYTIRPTLEPVQGTLTAEEIRQVILSCDPAHRAAYTVMFQGFLDQETFDYWNRHGYASLMEQLPEAEALTRDKRAVKLDLPGRKHTRNIAPYYSFIGHDGIEALKNWLKHRPQGAEAIVTNQRGKPISKSDLRHYWIHKLRRLGYVDPMAKGTRSSKTGKGLHEMRDVARSLSERSPANKVVIEYVMGHQIDKLQYNKSFRDVDHYRGEYLKALPYLEIMTGGAAFNKVDGEELVKLRSRLEKSEDENVKLREQLKEMQLGQAEEMQQLKANNEELRQQLEGQQQDQAQAQAEVLDLFKGFEERIKAMEKASQA